VIGVIAVFAVITVKRNNSATGNLQYIASNTVPPEKIQASADWISSAVTIDELILEADLVVRVKVFATPVTRVLRHELPVWDENNNIVGTTISETLFSDTVFEVIKAYRGEPPLNITVMQTGGYDPGVANRIVEVIDDPLYSFGEEYILFLVDISGDSVHALDRELYRIVNPYGRIRIDGASIISYGEDPVAQLSTISSATDLEVQIEQLVQGLDK
jgi:hypothetical protein